MKSAFKLRASPRTLIGMAVMVANLYPVKAQMSPMPWTPVGETSTPGADYSRPEYWMMAPQNPSAHAVDVLFFHTTTYKDRNYVDPATGAYLTVPRDPAI